MTDEKIEKGLECCCERIEEGLESCALTDCPFCPYRNSGCQLKLMEDAYPYLNHLKERIAELEKEKAVSDRALELMAQYVYNSDFPYEVCENQHARYGAEYDDYCDKWGHDCEKCCKDYFTFKAKQELEKEKAKGE